MRVAYDKYYQTKNLFGEPYPELIEFLSKYPKRGKVLDLGCGQGRNAIALARLGYHVTGIDKSKVGIEQMNQIGRAENLTLDGQVADIYVYDKFNEFDIILFDSMFHFAKKEKEKEIALIDKIVSEIIDGCLVAVCIQDTGNKVQILNKAIDHKKEMKRVLDAKFQYNFKDDENGHISQTDYRMIIFEK